MRTLVFSAGLLSIDSLLISAALSPLLVSRRQRWVLAALFGICDAFATIVGSNLQFEFARWIAPFSVVVLALYFLIAIFWRKVRADVRLTFFLPIVMSLDNFAYGTTSGPLTTSVATHSVMLGLTSFAFALLGLYAGKHLSQPFAPQRFTGFALLAAGLFLFFN